MKINYEKLAEILEPYGLKVNGTVIKGIGFDDDEVDHEIVWLNLESGNIDKIAENVKNNTFASSWVTTIKVLVPILHPHYDEIFEREINKEKLIAVFKKYGGWDVDGGDLYIPQNNTGEINYYNVDILIRKYTLRDCTNPGQDVILSFMHHHEDKFME